MAEALRVKDLTRRLSKYTRRLDREASLREACAYSEHAANFVSPRTFRAGLPCSHWLRHMGDLYLMVEPMGFGVMTSFFLYEEPNAPSDVGLLR